MVNMTTDQYSAGGAMKKPMNDSIDEKELVNRLKRAEEFIDTQAKEIEYFHREFRRINKHIDQIVAAVNRRNDNG